MPREQVLAETFVELADTLVADFDVVDFLHTLTGRCVELLDVQAAGLMLVDSRGMLRVTASSSEQARMLELFELESAAGPCVHCFQAGRPMADLDLDDLDQRWAVFAGHARRAGFRSVHALPLRLRTEIIGVLNLFATKPGPLSDDDVRLGQAMANVTTIGLLQQRTIRHHQVLAEQLQGALNSRVVIEQAKGVLAERMHVDMHVSFNAMRTYARRINRRLSDVARDVVDGTVEPSAVTRGSD
jgi:GAF domain-containing protein